jgi:hypothetical protein
VPGKTVYDHEGHPVWAEVIIRTLLEADGWHAVWVKNFGGGRKFWIDMDSPIEIEVVAGQVLASIDDEIDKLLGVPTTSSAERLKRGGVWDVFAVKDQQSLFVEDKYAPGLNRNQKVFLEAALQLMTPPTFIILNRTEAFEPSRA